MNLTLLQHKHTLPLVFLLLFIQPGGPAIAQEYSESGYELMQQMFDRTNSIRTISYKMNKKERFGEEMVEQESFIKLSRDPYMVYNKQLSPKEGVEVLYVEGDNNNEALVNPNGFPWMNLDLDPYGSTMRSDQHHTILDAGYDLVISILEHLYSKYGAEAAGMTSVTGEADWYGNPCYVVEVNNPYFTFNEYTVKKGETLVSIASDQKLSEYMIMERNNLDGYDDVSEGDVIEIPNDYSPRMILYIDKKRQIPLVMKVYDDKGLYENYEYREVRIDPAFSSDEFSSGYEEYDF